MSREELLLKKKEDVATIAKDNGITLSSSNKRKTKEQLVDEILSKEEIKETEVESNNVQSVVSDDEEWKPIETEKSESEQSEEKTENDLGNELTAEVESAERESKKKSYIENVKMGTLVAFKSYTGKVKSAKVVKRSTKNRKLKVETKYGAEFIISFDDVIWVRTNKRWPKGVYQLLKGVTEDEQK